MHVSAQDSAKPLEGFRMNKLAIMAIAVALLSGCAYGSYIVRMGVADGDSLTYREKQGIDSELAEDGR